MTVLHNANLLRLIFTNDSLLKAKQTFDKTKNVLICNILLKILSFDKIFRSMKHKSILVDQHSKISFLSLLPNGDLIALSGDRTICIWDSKTFICTKSITNETSIASLNILSDGKILISCVYNKFKVFEPSDLKCIKTIPIPLSDLYLVFLLSNNNLVCSFQEITRDYSRITETKIFIMDYNQDYKVLTQLEGSFDRYTPMANLSKNRFAYVCKGVTIKVYDILNKFKCLGNLTNEDQTYTSSLLFINNVLLSAFNYISIKVWDVDDYHCIWIIYDEHFIGINKIFILKNEYFVSYSSDVEMKVWDFNAFKCINTLKGVGFERPPVLLRDYRIAYVSKKIK
jgi:WD40 repeat protein